MVKGLTSLEQKLEGGTMVYFHASGDNLPCYTFRAEVVGTADEWDRCTSYCACLVYIETHNAACNTQNEATGKDLFISTLP